MDKFQINQKWFFVGIAIALLSPLGGLIYGLVLIFEPEHRKEGVITIAVSVAGFFIWIYLQTFVVGPWQLNKLIESGKIPADIFPLEK